jgi:hypothetical protein
LHNSAHGVLFLFKSIDLDGHAEQRGHSHRDRGVLDAPTGSVAS